MNKVGNNHWDNQVYRHFLKHWLDLESFDW